ncbi:MAG: glycosyltransferase family 2 protein [bacterium]|nr:glycosyltransferase family 2 protein [bacterium]
MSVSVCIITKNEAERIEKAVRSASFADEVVVVDSFSSDNTAGICEKLGCKVFKRVFDDYSGVKNFALEKAGSDWVFFLDADELITKNLSKEIVKITGHNTDRSAFRVKRKVYIFGKRIRWGSAKDDAPVRLLRKGKCRFFQPVHEEVEVKGSTGLMSAYMEHHTTSSVYDYLEKFNKYTDLEAEYMYGRGVKPHFGYLAVKPMLGFLRGYVIKLGFLDGIRGCIFEVLSFFYVFNKYAKLRELIRVRGEYRKK